MTRPVRPPQAELRQLASHAFVWGYPLVRAAQLRVNTTRPAHVDNAAAAVAATGPLNSINHARMLATPQTRIGVAPNHDTLYSLAWLDTWAHAFVLESPDFGSRYYTFQMGQGDSSTDRSLGQRTHGGQLPPVFIHGPRFAGPWPDGMVHVRSRHRYLMVAGRILVDGPADLAPVHRLQDRISLKTWSSATDAGSDAGAGVGTVGGTPAPAALAAAEDLSFLDHLEAVVGDLSLSHDESLMVESLRRTGLLAAGGGHAGVLAPSQRAEVAAGLRDGEALVRQKTRELGRQVNGWSINHRGPRFGDDFLLRAAVAMDQIYIVEPEEALYPSARVDREGEVLDGRHDYRIRFAREDMPPVGAFWSITLYFAQGFMVPNAIDRWSIGDRTPGLLHDPDGGLEILVQHRAPQGLRRANWLPAPRSAFMLLMRLYLPGEAILSGRWVPPPVERVVFRP